MRAAAYVRVALCVPPSLVCSVRTQAACDARFRPRLQCFCEVDLRWFSTFLIDFSGGGRRALQMDRAYARGHICRLIFDPLSCRLQRAITFHKSKREFVKISIDSLL